MRPPVSEGSALAALDRVDEVGIHGECLVPRGDGLRPLFVILVRGRMSRAGGVALIAGYAGYLALML